MGRKAAGELPAMTRHPKGYARVRFAGKEFALGPWGSARAQARFDELLAEWLAGGRSAPPGNAAPLPRATPAQDLPPAPPRKPDPPPPPPTDLTLGELGVRWLEWIEASRRSGRKSSAWAGARCAIRALAPWRSLPAKAFGPRLYQEVRVHLADTPCHRRRRIDGRIKIVPYPRSRRHILDTMERVRAMIAFGVSEELLPGDRLHALEAVPRMPDDLGEHRAPRTAVPEEHVLATLERMTPTLRALVEFISWTGCRPSEAAHLRMIDVEETAGRVWKFRPARHKSRWRGKPRIIPVGPRAQEILRRAAAGKDPDAVVFDARESLPSIPGSSQNRKPSPRVKGPYSTQAIRHGIVRAARLAGVPDWTTYQLRHLRLQEVRRTAGREAAQAVAGHNRSTMVDHYAPPSWEAGEAYAAEHG